MDFSKEEVLSKITKMEGSLHFLREAVLRDDAHTSAILLNIVDKTSKELCALNKEIDFAD